MGGDYQRGLYKDYERLVIEHKELDKKYDVLKNEYQLQEQKIARLKKKEAELMANSKEQLSQIEALKKEVARLTALMEADSNNSGLPTAKTPINKKKRIPNSRPKTDKHIGGQPGHTPSKLEPFKDEEVTEHEIHTEPVCPECGGELVRKVRHHFPNCRCKKCGKTTRAKIPQALSGENQYGSRTRALILALANDGNMSIKKIGRTLRGLTDGEICPSDGYIAKQQRIAAQWLEPFNSSLSQEVCKLPLVYWDDTVIMISKRRGCLRFYGNEGGAGQGQDFATAPQVRHRHARSQHGELQQRLQFLQHRMQRASSARFAESDGQP